MQQLDILTDDADQIVSFPLSDGTNVQMEFVYRAGVQRWTMNLTHPLLNLEGYNLVVSPNILRQWKNLIPFGICILSATGLDPMEITDFLNNVCTINMLSAEEVLQVESEIMLPIPLVNP